MSRKVKPVNVSALIKCSRWSLLALGIACGIVKLKAFQVYEHTARPKRLEEIKEKYARLKMESGIRDSKEIYLVGKECEIDEFPPGWNDEL